MHDTSGDRYYLVFESIINNVSILMQVFLMNVNTNYHLEKERRKEKIFKELTSLLVPFHTQHCS